MRRVGLALTAGVVQAVIFSAPIVSNVRFAQRPGTNLVDIEYDLSNPGRDSVLSVSFEVSTDRGRTFTIRPQTFSGDAGERVRVGRNRRITWDMYADIKRLKTDSAVIRVLADDRRQAVQTPQAKAPAGLVFERRNGQGYEEYRSIADGAVMIRIPAGEFWMGSPKDEGETNERPQHRVFLSEFYMDKFEVTNKQYRQFCVATGRPFPVDPGFPGLDNYFETCPDYPVVNVSWQDAVAYAAWAGKDLPTEAEWEKAARGQSARRFPWGYEAPTGGRANLADRSTDYAWSEQGIYDGHARAAPVGSFVQGASPYGVMDMAGNVWEWCRDWYSDDYYRSSPGRDPEGPRSGRDRVIRGGGWNYGVSYLRCAARQGLSPTARAPYLGFRCVRRG
ncbi:MAG: formylglycine-generating enzyme family protein [candidate division WOR-3 bacterium]